MLARNSPTVSANTINHPTRAAKRLRPARVEDARASVLPANSSRLLCSGLKLTCTFQPELATRHDDRRRRTCHLTTVESVGLLDLRQILDLRLSLRSGGMGQRFETQGGSQLFGAVVPAWLAEHCYPAP